jgi:hypothetical protein
MELIDSLIVYCMFLVYFSLSYGNFAGNNNQIKTCAGKTVFQDAVLGKIM